MSSTSSMFPKQNTHPSFEILDIDLNGDVFLLVSPKETIQSRSHGDGGNSDGEYDSDLNRVINPNNAKESAAKLRVSSSILFNASKSFGALFAPCSAEGQDLCNSATQSELKEIKIIGCKKAVVYLCALLHKRLDLVPACITGRDIWALVELADEYGCLALAQPLISEMLKSPGQEVASLPTSLGIAYILRNESAFHTLSSALVFRWAGSYATIPNSRCCEDLPRDIISGGKCQVITSDPPEQGNDTMKFTTAILHLMAESLAIDRCSSLADFLRCFVPFNMQYERRAGLSAADNPDYLTDRWYYPRLLKLIASTREPCKGFPLESVCSEDDTTVEDRLLSYRMARATVEEARVARESYQYNPLDFLRTTRPGRTGRGGRHMPLATRLNRRGRR
ncbi:hypothetical protein LTR66_008775 [Elasticomyces elasticus]|nr:hypothetical protein LTR66_008775 [Elasticomyces elasticus]